MTHSMETSSTSSRNLGIWIGVCFGVLIVLGLTCFVGNKIRTQWKLKIAQEQLGRGFPALAADTLDEFRHSALKSRTGCSLLLATYRQSRHLDRLEWAAQGCLHLGKEPVAAYLALAAVRQMTSRENEALQVLGQAAQQFDKVPDFYHAAAQIFRQAKRDQEAMTSFLQAIERAPQNASLILEAVDYFLVIGKKDEAKALADQKLKTAQTDNLEIKLILARIYTKFGESDTAGKFEAEARAALANVQPELKARIEAAYQDVLNKEKKAR